MSILESISMFLRQSVQYSTKHRYIATPWSWIIMSHSLCICSRIGLVESYAWNHILVALWLLSFNLSHYCPPVVKRLLVVLLLLPQLRHSFISLDVALVAGVVFFLLLRFLLLPLCPLCCHSCWFPASVVPATVAAPPAANYNRPRAILNLIIIRRMA